MLTLAPNITNPGDEVMPCMVVCKYCEDQGPSRGFLWTDNNGPIVACPFCNAEYDTPAARRSRAYDAAEYQRIATAQRKEQT